MFGQGLIGIVLTIVAILVIVVSMVTIREQLRALRRGYSVKANVAESTIRFTEKVGNIKRSLILPGELIEHGHVVYRHLSHEEWLQHAPEWDSERKLEIECKILALKQFSPSK